MFFILVASVASLSVAIPFSSRVMSLTSAVQYGQLCPWLEMHFPQVRQWMIIARKVK